MELLNDLCILGCLFHYMGQIRTGRQHIRHTLQDKKQSIDRPEAQKNMTQRSTLIHTEQKLSSVMFP
jgi:dsRNA-specific ribonuclease